MLNNYLLFFLLLLTITACGTQQQDSKSIDRTRTIEVGNELVIGLDNEADSVAQILGQPVGVVTDKEGNIYIGDKASLTIKVFDKDGNYLKSLGGRGRGPNEFHDINFMGAAPENNILVLDRGNFRYTTITKEGEYVSDYVIKFENQFYFKSLKYFDDKIIGLYLSADVPSRSHPVFERNFFHVYSSDFQNIHYSFISGNEIGIKDMFAWNTISIYPGSFELLKDQKILFYSPGIYTGTIYKYEQVADDKWKLFNKLELTTPHSDPYYFYESESEYQENLDYPGTNRIYYGSGPHYGRLNSIDTGIFYLPKREYLVQFYAEWREGDVTMEDGNSLDLSMQIFDLDGNIIEQSYLLSMQVDKRPNYSLVNWMDEEENFYMIDYVDSAPVIRRFALDL